MVLGGNKQQTVAMIEAHVCKVAKRGNKVRIGKEKTKQKKAKTNAVPGPHE